MHKISIYWMKVKNIKKEENLYQEKMNSKQ